MASPVVPVRRYELGDRLFFLMPWSEFSELLTVAEVETKGE
jgi:hypothetical protein